LAGDWTNEPNKRRIHGEKDISVYDTEEGPPVLKPSKKLVRRSTQETNFQSAEQRDKEKAKPGISGSSAMLQCLTR